MIITAELARHIVDNIMPLVQQNINIMDSSGLIIGSGESNRLNTYHQGAMEVIRSGKAIEIYPENLEQYPGARPGLNWPIILGSQVVGVVGVSGHPDAVRNTTKLVKMVTELILERESLVEEFRANLQLREQFLHMLLAEHCREHSAQIEKVAKLLRFKLDLPRLAAVVSVSVIVKNAFSQYGEHDLITSRARETLTQLLDASLLITAADLFFFVDDELIIFKHFTAEATVEDFKQWASALLKQLDCERHRDLRLGMGSLAFSPFELRDSYKEAQFAQTKSQTGASVDSIYDFDTLIAFLIREPGAIHSCYALQCIKNRISTQIEVKYDMRNTVNMLLANNLNVSSAAKALYIHRNTLVFRLEKLKQLTGLCPGQSLNHAMLCRIIFS
ncbi:CdaR family transcriptional regulator [Sporomusa aerivorans]|uniref:CdaR family transcriptional regulator n=1 Tax=Sporomusa aerivorans TaxID=204936 RepID=UPI00352A27FB